MRFNRLNVPDHWNQYYTKYPEGYTILESLLNWVAQVDNMVDNQNALNDSVETYQKTVDDFIEDFSNKYDKGLTKTITDILHEWKDNGFIDTVISAALQLQVDSFGVNPTAFGLSESATNNYQSVIDTINHVKSLGGGKIIFPHGKTFKFTQPLGTIEASNLIIDLNGSTLDFTAVPPSNSESALHITGTLGTPTPIVSNAVENQKIVQCNTAGFTKGDMVKVYSNKVWDSTRTSTRIGEIAFVEKIDSSSQLTLTTPLNDNYNVSDSANIVKITPAKNITIRDGKIKGALGDNEMRGLRVTRGLDVLIEGISINGCDVNQLQLTDCVRATIENCFFQEANHSSMGYGVSVSDASQDIVISNNHFTDVRHSLSTNNNVTTSWGITRRITFSENTVTDSSPALSGSGGDGIDTHAGAEEVFIIDNEVFSSSGLGINCEGRSAEIRGNRIKTTGSVGIYFNPYADGKPSRVKIIENTVTLVGDKVGSDYGIQAMARLADMLETIITDNIVESQNAGIRLLTGTGFRHQKAVVANNALKVEQSGYGIDATNSDYAVIQGNSIEAQNYPIALTDVQNSVVQGNALKINGVNASRRFGVRVMTTSSRNVIAGNTAKNTGSVVDGSYGVEVADTATYNNVANNICSEGFNGAVLLGTGTGNVQSNNL